MLNDYSAEFKEALVQKVLLGSKTIKEVARQTQVSYSALKEWVRAYKRGQEASLSARRPQDWKAAERLQVLIETASMSEEALSAYCREKGIYAHHITQWREAFIEGGHSEEAVARQALRTLQEDNRRLERELAYKEKALAEACALLVLQKKAPLILGGREN